MSKRKRLAVVSWRHRARHDEDFSLSRWLFLIWHWERVPLLCVKSSGWGAWLMARPAKPVLANRGRPDTQLRRVCAGHPISAFRRLCRWGANEHLICVTESKPRFRPSYFCQPSYFWVLVFTALCHHTCLSCWPTESVLRIRWETVGGCSFTLSGEFSSSFSSLGAYFRNLPIRHRNFFLNLALAGVQFFSHLSPLSNHVCWWLSFRMIDFGLFVVSHLQCIELVGTRKMMMIFLYNEI